MDWIQLTALFVVICFCSVGIIGKLNDIHIALINFATMLADLLEGDKDGGES